MKALQINNLRKTYKSGTVALRGINLEIEEGDFFALLGANGAGKTTTIGILTGLVNKSKGDAQVFGHDIDESFEKARECIGVVPQEFNFNIFSKVIDILVAQAGFFGIPRKQALKNAEPILKALNLWGKRNATALSLSGGMKRRLMIARGLIHHPRLLILDEPTAGVDLELRHDLWKYLTRLREEQRITILLTTHYLEEAEELCRNIAIIDHGEIVEDTNMKQLLGKLDIETFVLDLREEIQQPPRLEGMDIHCRDENTIEVSLPRSKSLNALFAELDDQGFHVTSMRNKANRLEELFLRLVEKGASS